MGKRVFVTGGTGLVGTRLVKLLLGRGDTPVVLTRRPGVAGTLGSGVEVVSGDPMVAGEWMQKVESCDAVIHLAGENVFAKRWNAAFQKLLVDSRVLSTRNIAAALVRKPVGSDGQPKVLVNASAIGIYGPRGDEEITEESGPGSDFLAKLCVEWEAETQPAAKAGVRTVQVRVGVVLDRAGGALGKMLTPFKLGAGGPIGSGKQYMAWIHHEDMTGLLLFALDNGAVQGPMNGTAPQPVTNKEFSKALGKALHRPAFMWTPGFMLRVMLGEGANIILQGQRVVPQKAVRAGYVFKYPTVQAALAQMFA